MGFKVQHVVSPDRVRTALGAELLDPSSSKLELTPAHYASDLFNPLTGADVRAFLRDRPELRAGRAVMVASSEASAVYGFPDNSGSSRLLRRAVQLGVDMYLTDPTLFVDTVPFPANEEVPTEVLREFGRLGAQHIMVYEAVAVTGNVPGL
jgi:hypothetical protein